MSIAQLVLLGLLVVLVSSEQALVFVDDRRDYGEVRYVGVGPIGGRFHVLRFTETNDGVRVISLRKANAREVTRYAKVQATR